MIPPSRSRVPPSNTRPEDGYSPSPGFAITPPTTRIATRALRANSTISDFELPSGNTPKARPVPVHYLHPPTHPSPFTGTLDASLDAILNWGIRYTDIQKIVDTLLREVDTSTNWPELLVALLRDGDKTPGRGRYLVEELLFLVTRTLFPEQITENRALMARMYERRTTTAIRMILRYDMLREWKMDAAGRSMAVESLAPAEGEYDGRVAVNPARPHRRPLMPNILATLIAAPEGGWTMRHMRERMKHYVTDLDNYLLLTDEEVGGWDLLTLVEMTSMVVLHWQWLRQNNERFGDLEAHDYEELDSKMNLCEWIADEPKRVHVRKRRERDEETTGDVVGE